MQTFVLPRHLTDALKTLSRQESVTLYMTLMAAFQALLHRYTGQDDLLLGTVTSTRKHPAVQHVVGYFLNTVVLRTDLSDNPTFRELLNRVRKVIMSARHHEDMPFDTIVKELHPQRSLSYQPLIQVLLSYQPQLLTLPPGWTLSQVDIQTHTSKFDLTLELDDRPEGLIGRFIYNTDLFDASTISRMVGHWQTLLEGIIANPSQHLSELPLLTEKERHLLLVDWNETGAIYADACFSQLFEEQVERSPEALALVYEHEQWTYRQLNTRANQLAHALKERGVGPEVMIGLCLERSPDLLIGLLGILKAGGVYVPLDPQAPADRLAFLLTDTQMPILLTQQRLLARLPAYSGQVLCLDRDWSPLISQYGEHNPPSRVQAENLAYVIYTSGSTGQPKGVLISHRALAAHCLTITQVYGLGPQDRVLQFSTYTFDASLEQMLPTLLVGAQLVLLGPELWTAAQLLSHLKADGLTVVNLPPAYWQQVLHEWVQTPAVMQSYCLRLLIVGGDQVPPAALHLWRQLPMLREVRLLNAYGPTETTITATLFEMSTQWMQEGNWERVPIGRPLPNRTIYLLDRAANPVPVGVAGEVHIGGALLARGYLNRADLTAERFIPDPFGSQPGGRLYKTGDLARYLPDGTIEFVGRVNQQVKIRGYRIELGEIEAVLSQHQHVREALVEVRPDNMGEPCLVGYVISEQGQRLESRDLRSYLEQKLPEYMLPAAFVQLEQLPLLVTGKPDRRALPAPKLTRLAEETFVAPRLLIHQHFVQIWEELLDVHPIGIKDNFFHLGGHSLLAARLVDRIEHNFGKRIALSTLFSGPTIEQLAAALQQENAGARASLLPVQVSGSKRPFFFLHGDWTGGAFYCFALARALGPDQPFYVLEPYKFGGLKAVPSLESIAAAHIESLRAIQPEGPYLLGGFCNGGLLAYEMARQLRAAGEQVDFLALINPSSPVQLKLMRAVSNSVSKLLRFGTSKQANLFLRVRHALRHVYRHLRPTGSRVQDFDQLLAIDSRLEAIFPPIDALYHDYVGVFNWVVSRYETSVYPGKITFYWASEEPYIEHSWASVTAIKSSEDIENHVVPGTHMSCVTENMQYLAESLSICVSRASEEVLSSL